jgi:regulatory protein
MKGYEPEIGEEVVARLRELGMIDDAAFAGTLVRDRVRLRPQGARRLASELRAKGVDDETARAAIRDLNADAVAVLQREAANAADLVAALAALDAADVDDVVPLVVAF